MTHLTQSVVFFEKTGTGIRKRPGETRVVFAETTDFIGKVAGVTGLEPAASGVTGRRSNQLSYTPNKCVSPLRLR